MRGFARHLLGTPSDRLSPIQRATHTYVIGQPGTGKSRALESWIMQDVLAGNGVGVIDPHGELFQHLLLRIAHLPQVWERVVIVDPLDATWAVSFNPLAPIHGVAPERIAVFLKDVVMKIWKLSDTGTPRMARLLTNTFLALSQLGMSLLDFPRFIQDRDRREGWLEKLPGGAARDYFRYEFPTSPGAINQWITPALNKIGPFLFDPDVRPMLAGRPTVDFRQMMDNRLIFLANIPKGILGEGTSALLAAFLVARFQQGALGRTASGRSTPFYLYLDEFQNYTTDNIEDVLTEARKYALSLTLAHQYLDQLSSRIQEGVLNTAGTLVSFRVGYGDAYRLAKDVFPHPDFLSRQKRALGMNYGGLWPRLTLKETAEKSGWESLALELSSLPQRTFWARKRTGFKPSKHRTFDMPTPRKSEELKTAARQLRRLSGRQFGRLKHDPQDRAVIHEREHTPLAAKTRFWET